MYVHMVTVRIYTTDYCSYCSAAKQLLGARSVSFEEIDCTKDPETRKWLVDTTGRKAGGPCGRARRPQCAVCRPHPRRR